MKIIITGLLSDTEDEHGNSVEPGGDKLVELALSLNDDQEQSAQRTKNQVSCDFCATVATISMCHKN